MDIDKKIYLDGLNNQIETNKRNALKEIENEEFVPAMWSISSLIDLKAQKEILTKTIKDIDDKKIKEKIKDYEAKGYEEAVGVLKELLEEE